MRLPFPPCETHFCSPAIEDLAMNIIENAVCPGCTLLCDDVTYQLDGQRIQSSVQCKLAQQWIDWANSQIDIPRQSADEVQAVIRHLVACVKQSKMPLIAGLANLTLQGQQVAWRVADITGAALDKSIGPHSQASLYAFQRQGKVSASLGEVANRGDLLIFWFCDPAQTHPRLLEKLKSNFNKTVVVVDSTKTETAKLADRFITVEENDAIEFLSAARRLLSGEDAESALTTVDGIGHAAMRLVELATKCRYGCFIYDQSPKDGSDAPVTLAHQKLMRRLNDFTRLVSIALRTDGNGQSAENVMTAFSGYPFAVSHAKGIPEYCGDIWSASRLLERRQCDFLLLFVGRNWKKELASLDEQARANLAAIPKVVIHSGPRPDSALLENARMLQVAIAGASGSGDYCRLDNVLLPMTALRESKLPTDEELLCRVLNASVAALR